MTSEDKQARLDRLNHAPPITRGPSPTKDFIRSLQKIDRYCSSRFGAAVAAGRIFKDEAQVISFAKLPGSMMTKADLTGVHDLASLDEFLKDEEKLPSQPQPQRESPRGPSPDQPSSSAIPGGSRLQR